MIVSSLWEALSAAPAPAHQGVTMAVNDESGIVVYGTGTLEFFAGTVDRVGRHPRPDQLSGQLTWYYSNRRSVRRPAAGFEQKDPFDPEGTDTAELTITRRPLDVSATVRLPFGSTTFELRELGDIYVGVTTAIGGEEQIVYTFSFPGKPSTPPR